MRFENLHEWLIDIRRDTDWDITICLVGNKSENEMDPDVLDCLEEISKPFTDLVEYEATLNR